MVHNNVCYIRCSGTYLYHNRNRSYITPKFRRETTSTSRELKRGILILLVSTFGYLVYVVVIRLFNIDGWSALLPQAIGMVLGGILLTFKHRPFNKYAIRNIIPGLIWAAGNICFIYITAACRGSYKLLPFPNGDCNLNFRWHFYIR